MKTKLTSIALIAILLLKSFLAMNNLFFKPGDRTKIILFLHRTLLRSLRISARNAKNIHHLVTTLNFHFFYKTSTYYHYFHILKSRSNQISYFTHAADHHICEFLKMLNKTHYRLVFALHNFPYQKQLLPALT